ncbi:hypothetical protein EV421DRAFT_1736132 [Armillaria borealis]|uniref:Uncharacterized protein n=1 Tax=Armillaria borealis TaxID=47425 RepID=A0AA39JLG7_9AGAR|nr:hypothetical protein EV421DRAFT_1736132 [Armillaria borealis]
MIISQQDTRRVLAFSPSSVLWLFLALLAVVLTLVYPSMRNTLSPALVFVWMDTALAYGFQRTFKIRIPLHLRLARCDPSQEFSRCRACSTPHAAVPTTLWPTPMPTPAVTLRLLGDTFSDERLYAFGKGIVRNGIFMRRLYTHTM